MVLENGQRGLRILIAIITVISLGNRVIRKEEFHQRRPYHIPNLKAYRFQLDHVSLLQITRITANAWVLEDVLAQHIAINNALACRYCSISIPKSNSIPL